VLLTLAGERCGDCHVGSRLSLQGQSKGFSLRLCVRLNVKLKNQVLAIIRKNLKM
jgi:hypothetical protein